MDVEAKEIRDARLKLGWSQERLAGALGVTVKSVHRWETRQSIPSLLSAYKIKQLLG